MQVEGLQIRRAEPDDSSALYEMFGSSKVFENTLQLPYPFREQWQQRLVEPSNGTYNLVAVASSGVVGMISIHTFPNTPRRRHVGTIDIAVHAEWHRKGIGKTLMRAGIELADNWLNLMRLELEVYIDNEAAIRLYEQFGFEREGTLRQHAFRDGKYVSSYMMARLRPSSSST